MSINNVNSGVFQKDGGFTVKLHKGNGIIKELKNVFEEMKQQGLIKDVNNDGLTEKEAANLYSKLNEFQQANKYSTNYTKMAVGSEFKYSAEQMKAMAQAAGFEVVENTPKAQEAEPETKTETPPYHAKIAEMPKDKDIGLMVYDKNAGKTEEEVRAEFKKQKEDLKEQRDAALKDAPDRASKKEIRENYREQKAALKLQEKISKAKADFTVGDQVGKIVNGKYYINGYEVDKSVYDMAKTKSLSMNNADEVKPNDVSEHGNVAENNNKKTDAQLAEYLKNDTNYQKHKKTLSDLDTAMKIIEKKYGIERGNFRDEAYKLGMKNKQDSDKYFTYKLAHKNYSENLPRYEKQMATWKDGPCGEDSYYSLNGTTWTNLERITLANGQRAWKTDQGTFYPGPSGMPGHDKVPAELI